jgi:hypothetical protein
LIKLDGKIIVKFIVKKQVVKMWTLSDPGWGPKTVSYEGGNGHSGFVEGGKFIHEQNYVMRDSVICRLT